MARPKDITTQLAVSAINAINTSISLETSGGTVMARPEDGRGKGKGVKSGRRGNRNTKPCPQGGPGRGQGGGRGRGTGRKG